MRMVESSPTESGSSSAPSYLGWVRSLGCCPLSTFPSHGTVALAVVSVLHVRPQRIHLLHESLCSFASLSPTPHPQTPATTFQIFLSLSPTPSVPLCPCSMASVKKEQSLCTCLKPVWVGVLLKGGVLLAETLRGNMSREGEPGHKHLQGRLPVC